jgi:amino-acid N-acetyltransferase
MMEIHHAEPRDHAAITELVRSSRLPLDLTRAALDLASARGLRRIYLPTETAEGCFPRFGFRRITRDEVPGPVRESVEFRTA